MSGLRDRPSPPPRPKGCPSCGDPAGPCDAHGEACAGLASSFTCSRRRATADERPIHELFLEAADWVDLVDVTNAEAFAGRLRSEARDMKRARDDFETAARDLLRRKEKLVDSITEETRAREAARTDGERRVIGYLTGTGEGQAHAICGACFVVAEIAGAGKPCALCGREGER